MAKRKSSKKRKVRSSSRSKSRIMGTATPKGFRVSRKSRRAKQHRGLLINPIGKLFNGKDVLGSGMTVIDVLGLAGGGIAVRYIPSILPIPEQYKSGNYRLIVQAGSAIALGYVISNVLKQKRLGKMVMIGGLVSTAITALDTYVFKGQLASGDLSVYLPSSSVAAFDVPAVYPSQSQTVSSSDTDEEAI